MSSVKGSKIFSHHYPFTSMMGCVQPLLVVVIAPIESICNSLLKASTTSYHPFTIFFAKQTFNASCPYLPLCHLLILPLLILPGCCLHYPAAAPTTGSGSRIQGSAIQIWSHSAGAHQPFLLFQAPRWHCFSSVTRLRLLRQCLLLCFSDFTQVLVHWGSHSVVPWHFSNFWGLGSDI